MNATAFPLDTPLAPTETKASTALPQNGLSSRQQQQQSAGWDDVIIQPAFEVPLAAKYGGEGVWGGNNRFFYKPLAGQSHTGVLRLMPCRDSEALQQPAPPLFVAL